MSTTHYYKTEVEGENLFSIPQTSVSENYAFLELLTKCDYGHPGSRYQHENLLLNDFHVESALTPEVGIDKNKLISAYFGFIISEVYPWDDINHPFQDIIFILGSPKNNAVNTLVIHSQVGTRIDPRNYIEDLDIKKNENKERLLRRLEREEKRLSKRGINLKNKDDFIQRTIGAINYFTSSRFDKFILDLELTSDSTSFFTAIYKDYIEIHFEIFSKHVNDNGDEEVLFNIYFHNDCLGTGWDTNKNALDRIDIFLDHHI